jgi:hypothetical protein
MFINFMLYYTGQSAAISIGNNEIFKKGLRKGMVLVSADLKPKACKQFDAEIYLLYHANYISKGFQATIHVGNVCQTAQICEMENETLKTNEKTKVTMRFMSRAEFIVVGSKLIFREGATKGMGTVTKIYPYGKDLLCELDKQNENRLTNNQKSNKRKISSLKEIKRIPKNVKLKPKQVDNIFNTKNESEIAENCIQTN